MSETVELGAVDPAGSRHGGRRSALALTDDLVVVGGPDGTVRALARAGLDERWSQPGNGGSVVSATAVPGGVAVGERSAAGSVRVYDADGRPRWRYDTADDLGEPAKETRFLLPFVVDAVSDSERLYVAARRYERHGDRPEGERRQFTSVVYAFEGSEERWRFVADASPIALDACGDRVAVAYNRCPGSHQQGLVVLDAATGGVRRAWDPPGGGQRRVGDVALLEEGLVLTSHADYRGYALDSAGDVRWRRDLARPETIDGETVYAYPNHVHASERGVVFVTGNTYPEEGREAESLHPAEHTAVGYSREGGRRWAVSVGGFASALASYAGTIAVPCAQNFRRRDRATHACRLLAVESGAVDAFGTDGVVTAAAIDGHGVAAIEEPVVYHDDGEVLGAFRLHVPD